MTLRLEDAELARLIEGGEGSRVEFKEKFEGSAPEEIREAICAFANDLSGTQEPGIVVVGLRDDLTPVKVADATLLALSSIRGEGNIVPPRLRCWSKNAHGEAERSWWRPYRLRIRPRFDTREPSSCEAVRSGE